MSYKPNIFNYTFFKKKQQKNKTTRGQASALNVAYIFKI